MAKLSLKRLLRGPQAKQLEQLQSLCTAPFYVTDIDEKALYGEPYSSSDVFSVHFGERELGSVHGDASAAVVAGVLCLAAEREAEKRALADETLERYKELTLLYDLSDSLSEVLNVEAVARRVVQAVHGFLKGAQTSLLIRSPGQSLHVVACEPQESLAEDVPDEVFEVESRVLQTGRAELFQFETGAVLSAPLRDSQGVFGLLRARHDDGARWTAAELKLITSLASTAAGAVRHAVLHQGQLEEQARRSDLARFVSPELVACAVQEGARDAVVLLCDLNRATALGRNVSPESVLRVSETARRKALHLLIGLGATVNVTQNDIVVAVISCANMLTCAQTGSEAARALVALVDDADPQGFLSDIGIGLAYADTMNPELFFEAVQRAAELQAYAHGRIFTDRWLAPHLNTNAVELENQTMFEVVQ